MMKEITLQELIESLCRESGMHIAVVDVSGVLNDPMLTLTQKYRIHSTAFCALAKSTVAGYQTCIDCKSEANDRATKHQTPFWDVCDYGILRYVYPVRIHGRSAAILYIGNLKEKTEESLAALHRTTAKTGVDGEALTALFSDCETVKERAVYETAARLIEQHMTYLYDNCRTRAETDGHWAVREVRRYIDGAYDKNLCLSDLSKMYYLNEQYLGRIFRREVGQSFRDYLASVRIRAAEELLSRTSESVTNIAMRTGFQTVTYFNRVFLQRHGMTPTAYREKYKIILDK